MSEINEEETNDASPEEMALLCKECGNRHYSNREFGDASKAYKKGLDFLKNIDCDTTPLAIALNANLAMISLKLKQFEEAAELCNWILAKEPQNSKGTNIA